MLLYVKRFQSTLPARGTTLCRGHCAATSSHFNPRSPHGERRRFKAATFVRVVISIHAPRTGSDLPGRFPSAAAAYFNPRSPHGERPPRRGRTRRRNGISIHAPRTGSDATVSGMTAEEFKFQSTLPARGATAPAPAPTQAIVPISIHAPRTGSDDKHQRS